MKLQKYILETLSFFKSKFYLEQNPNALEFEKAAAIWEDTQLLINATDPKKSLIKRDFSKVINTLKDAKKALETSSDRRLLTSLIDLLINVKRETNKQGNYSEVINTNIAELSKVCQISEKNSRIFKESRVISVRYPKKIK